MIGYNMALHNIMLADTVNPEIFIVKILTLLMAATKLMCTVNVNVARGHSYENVLHENLSYESFLTRKFSNLLYCTL